MQFILFTNRLRWIAPFTIFIENFIVLKSLIGNRVKKSALKDADQKKKNLPWEIFIVIMHIFGFFFGGTRLLFFYELDKTRKFWVCTEAEGMYSNLSWAGS